MDSSKKYLIIRFSSIGDIVLTTPILRCLKQQTGAEIHFLVKQKFSSTICNNPNIDRIWSFKSNLDEVLPDLSEERFDAIIDLHKNLRSLRVRLALRRKVYSFPKLNIEKWLMCQFKINRLPPIHIVDRYFKAIEPLGVKLDQKGLDFYFTSSTSLPADIELNDAFGVLPKEYIAWVMGANHATKRLPIHKIISIINRLDIPVILLGGKDVNLEAKEVFENVD
ncbi:MAG: glycosyltransferase family 9 protein, partial [Bacteroidota bacterium]